MQYFVVLEDIKELRWQAELLYESIRLLDLVDKFVVAICPSQNANGVAKHRYPNVIYFENVGRRIGFPQFNKSYGLARALESGKLKPPYALLDTDMFLLHGIPPTKAPASAQYHNWLTWENTDPRVRDLVEDKDHWKPLGGVYLFNEIPLKVYEDIMQYTYDLHTKFGYNPKWHTYGFNLAMANNRISFEEQRELEMPLTHTGSPDVRWNSSHIIHYKDGYAPWFHKSKVFDTINFSFNLPLPFKAILDAPIRNQPNVAIMQTLIRSWLDSNLTRVHMLL
jgi:hypothetical protein